MSETEGGTGVGGKTRLSLGFALLCGCLVLAGMAWARPVAVVGNEAIEEAEVLSLLRQYTEGSDAVAGVLLSRMSVEERKDYVEGLVDWLLLAREANLQGFGLRPDVAALLKWSAVGILGQAYLAEIGKNWDFSEAALRAYYDAHPERYAEDEGVRLRWCVAPDENDAKRMLLDLVGESIVSKEPAAVRGAHCVDTGWLYRNALPEDVAKEAFSALPGMLCGPVKVGSEYAVFRVLQKRENRLAPFDDVKERDRKSVV